MGARCIDATFYFAGELHVEVDSEAVRQRMFQEITRTGEVILGSP
jgi:hypothetical protein